MVSNPRDLYFEEILSALFALKNWTNASPPPSSYGQLISSFPDWETLLDHPFSQYLEEIQWVKFNSWPFNLERCLLKMFLFMAHLPHSSTVSSFIIRLVEESRLVINNRLTD